MGVRYSVTANSSLYVVVADRVNLYQAVFTGSLIDETSGKPIVSTPVMNVDVKGISLRVTEDGLIAGAAVLESVFPQTETRAYSLTLTVTAVGYRPASVPINVPIASVFPVIVPPVLMRRLPVRLQGRVVKFSDRSPLPDAVISSKDATQLLLRDTMRFAHAAGTPVADVSLTETGAPLSLVETATAGSDTILLNSNAGLTAGDLVQLGGPLRGAIHEIGSVGPGSALVSLVDPMVRSTPSGASLQVLTPAVLPGGSTLKRSSDAGDGVAVLTTALTGTSIQVIDGSSSEYHRLNVHSDPDGYFRADGIVGVQRLDLLCSDPSFPTFDQPWTPDYSQPTAIVDFLLHT